jgi:hypothetical protein
LWVVGCELWVVGCGLGFGMNPCVGIYSDICGCQYPWMCVIQNDLLLKRDTNYQHVTLSNKDAILPLATPIKLLVYWFTATSGESKRMLIFW